MNIVLVNQVLNPKFPQAMNPDRWNQRFMTLGLFNGILRTAFAKVSDCFNYLVIIDLICSSGIRVLNYKRKAVDEESLFGLPLKFDVRNVNCVNVFIDMEVVDIHLKYVL